jgi:hypothetical protein
MTRLSRRQIGILAIALAVIVLITLLLAPNTNLPLGSTYGRSPDGYGAWYTFMQERGTLVQRWQKPLEELTRPRPSRSPITLLQVSSERSLTTDRLKQWVKDGNVLVLLGVKCGVTKAPFRSILPSSVGGVQIETSRRETLPKQSSNLQSRLSDAYGSVVWQETLGKGRIIYASTPYLAANAYQDSPGNFQFLAQLVTEAGYPIWVDEYSHGYKDAEEIQRETSNNVITYLAKTPLSLLAIQIGVILLMLLWGQNQRLGPPAPVTAPIVDNSEAYIQAMAAVLREAECSEFVLDVIGKAEQLDIQTALGLGKMPLPLETVSAAWVQQTGQSAVELESLLQRAKRSRRIGEAALLKWVHQIQLVHRDLPDIFR